MNITVSSLKRGAPDQQIDDTSPQVRYWAQNGAWDPEHSADTFLDRYFGGTFHSSKEPGDTATITFWASGIEVHGAKRMNHDDYAVKLDDAEEVVLNGYSPPDGGEWQVPLYTAEDLALGQNHTVVFTNRAVTEERMWLDIDYVVLSGPSDITIKTSELDDTDPAFVYSDGWEQGEIGPGQSRHNSTVHVTRQKHASVDFTFSGVSCQVFGALDVDHSTFSVSLDDSDPIIFNGSYINFTSGVSLFAATGLPQTTHTVRFVNLGEGSTPAFDIDYAVVNSTKLGSLIITSDATAPNLALPVHAVQELAIPAPSNDPVDVRLVIASVVGSIVVLALIAMGLWIWHRRKTTDARQQQSARSTIAGVAPARIVAGDVGTKSGYSYNSNASWTIRTPPTPSDGGPQPVWSARSLHARQAGDAWGVSRPAPVLDRQQRAW